MSEEKYIQLNADEKEVALRELKNLMQGASHLKSLIDEEKLTEEMKSMMINLLLHYTEDAGKALHYEGKTRAEKDQDTQMIRSLNERIRELEGQIGNDNPTAGLKEKLNFLSSRLRKWWDNQHFNYIDSIRFSEGGNIIVTFGFMINSGVGLRHSNKPATKREQMKSEIQKLQDKGYDIYSKGRSETYVLNTPNNWELLTTLIHSTFPNSKISNVDIRRDPYENNENIFYFNRIEVYLYNAEEVVNLEIMEKDEE